MPTENLGAILTNQNSFLNSVLVGTEVHDFSVLVSASTSLQQTVLSEAGNKKLATSFIKTALILEG